MGSVISGSVSSMVSQAPVDRSRSGRPRHRRWRSVSHRNMADRRVRNQQLHQLISLTATCTWSRSPSTVRTAAGGRRRARRAPDRGEDHRTRPPAGIAMGPGRRGTRDVGGGQRGVEIGRRHRSWETPLRLGPTCPHGRQVHVAAAVDPPVEPVDGAVAAVVVGAQGEHDRERSVVAGRAAGHRSGPSRMLPGYIDRCSSHWTRNRSVNGRHRREVSGRESMRSYTSM